MKHCCAVLLLLLVPFLVPASSCLAVDKDIVVEFNRANVLYSDASLLAAQQRQEESLARFREAARLYEQILSSGAISWPVLYNLANAQYRQGRIGKAIVNYRRAERLAPRNADIRANLKQAKSQTMNREASGEMPSFFRSLLFSYYGLNLNEATILAAALYYAFCICEILFIFIRGRALKYMTILFLVLTVLSALSLVLKIQHEQRTPSGVVIASECPVRVGPGQEYNALFIAHEGADVVIEDQRPDARSGKTWLRVKVLVETEQRTDTEIKRVFGPEGYVQSANVEIL